MNEKNILNEEELDTVAGGVKVKYENGFLFFTCSCGAAMSAPEGNHTVHCPSCAKAWCISSRTVFPGIN